MSIWDVIGKVNKYIDSMAPWVLAKTDKDRLSTVMFYILESLRTISVLLWPFTPETAERMQLSLGLPKSGRDLNFDDIREWGKEECAKSISEVPHLFPRVETKEEEKPKMTNTIPYSTFQELDLRVGIIKKAESISGSKKLIKLTVDIGEERTVVAGIQGHYSEEDLLDKQVVLVANLEPAKLMGVESQGMVLAAEDESGVHLLIPDVSTKPGSKVK
jgi:methionyl-tRNA synthetase